MFTRMKPHRLTIGILALLLLILAACSPAAPIPQTGDEPTKPVTTPISQPEFSGLEPEDIVLQLTYEPGFVLPEYRYPFGRTPFFTLLADGQVIYVDESQDAKVMQAQLTQAEAAALRQQVLDLGFAGIESHTDMCGTMEDGSEGCIADASTSVLRVRMNDGSLQEIRNYANFSNDPAAYQAIYNLLMEYTHPEGTIYLPQAATLFVRIVPAPEFSSPADWPLDPAYVNLAQRSQPEQFTAVVLSADEAALWQREVGIDNTSITFQLEGQPVSGFFAPWLPGEDYAADIAAAFPTQ